MTAYGRFAGKARHVPLVRQAAIQNPPAIQMERVYVRRGRLEYIRCQRDGTLRAPKTFATDSIERATDGSREAEAMLILIIILLLVLGGGGGYYGHSRWGYGGGAGVGLGTILLILLVAYLLGILP